MDWRYVTLGFGLCFFGGTTGCRANMAVSGVLMPAEKQPLMMAVMVVNGDCNRWAMRIPFLGARARTAQLTRCPVGPDIVGSGLDAYGWWRWVCTLCRRAEEIWQSVAGG